MGSLTYFSIFKKKKNNKHIVALKKWVSGRVFLFVGNVLVHVRHIFLLDYPLVLSLLKPRSVRIFWNKKKFNPNRRSLLNSSINDSNRLRKGWDS